MTNLPAPLTRPLEDTETELEKQYHLILLDDDDHTYQYVIRMLNTIFGYTRDKGYAIACMVDSQGQAIVMTARRDKVLLKQEQIHAFGPDPLMETSLGSMSAILEPAS